MQCDVKIIASYVTACFCNYERPIPDGEPFSTEPRFNFCKEAKRFADKHGMTGFEAGEGNVAFARLPRPCQHRGEQLVRLSWTLSR